MAQTTARVPLRREGILSIIGTALACLNAQGDRDLRTSGTLAVWSWKTDPPPPSGWNRRPEGVEALAEVAVELVQVTGPEASPRYRRSAQ